MAISWPATLPAPQRSGLTIKPNPDVRVREAQSGRKELRRFGAGKPDTLTCTLRLFSRHPQHGDQVAAFKYFWQRDLNFGLNWISADWLPLLGYTSHYCRIVGYSPRRSMGSLYTDHDVKFALQKTTGAWADTTWPVYTNPTLPSQAGLVVGFGAQNTDGILDIPSGLKAVKVETSCFSQVSQNDRLSQPYAVAIRPDGTLIAWGSGAASLNSELSSLSGIVDIALSRGGGYYLTNAGTVGHFGSPSPGTVYPASQVREIFCSQQGSGIFVMESGLVELFGPSVPPSFASAIYNPKSVQVGRQTLDPNDNRTYGAHIVDGNGDVWAWRNSTGFGRIEGGGYVFGATNNMYAMVTGLTSFGGRGIDDFSVLWTPTGIVEGSGVTHYLGPFPTGLRPLQFMSLSSGGSAAVPMAWAIHQDRSLVGWLSHQQDNLLYPAGTGRFFWLTGTAFRVSVVDTDRVFFTIKGE